jgi:hypothetical protein
LDELFQLVARHPLLTRQQLARLLRTSVGRITQLLHDLVARGWLRLVDLDTVARAALEPTRDHLERMGLVELTQHGRLEAARRLMLPPQLARRRHGLMWGEESSRPFVRHVHHTLGANAFFVDLVVASRTRGHEEGLVEWRSAAACARGRFRPDGYGGYRRGPWRVGFFLEYDRGTEKRRQHATKLAAYYRYRDSGAYRRDFESFPTLLVVATSDEAETRFSFQAYLAQTQHAGAPLSMFLTTTCRIDESPSGALGPIWRASSGSPASIAKRGCWLPAARCPRSRQE